MAKAILEYDLENEGDRHDFETARRAHEYASALYSIDDLCRSKLKYSDTEIPEDIEKLLAEIRGHCSVTI